METKEDIRNQEMKDKTEAENDDKFLSESGEFQMLRKDGTPMKKVNKIKGLNNE